MSVGENIKMLRLERGWTQEELGNRLGVKKAAIQKYESGQVQNLKQTTIRTLCEIFDKNPSYFIFDDMEERLRVEVDCIEMINSMFGEKAVALLETFVSLNTENQDKVSTYVNDISIVEAVLNLKKN